MARPGYIKIDRPHLSLREQRKLELRDWYAFKNRKPRKKKVKRVSNKYPGWVRKYGDFSYDKLLLTPEWRAKRKEILERDNYTCTECGSLMYLEVHHLSYDNMAFPWMVSSKKLTTLCLQCHNKKHNQ